MSYITSTVNTLPNIAALYSSNLYNTYSDIFVSGYHTPGDGGGGLFYWDGYSSLTDDGGMVVKPSSVSGNGRWLRPATSIIDTRWYGSVADGYTDLGVYVNAADTFLGANAGTIIVPDGYYAINTKIALSANRTLKLGKGTFLSHVLADITISFGKGWPGTGLPDIQSNISIIGSGWETILVESDSLGGSPGVSFGYRIISVDDRNETGDVPQYGNYVIKNLKLQGFLGNPVNATLSTLNVSNAHDVLIQNVWMHSTNALGIQLGGSSLASGGRSCERAWVVDCLLEDVSNQPIAAVNTVNCHINRNTFKCGPTWTIGTLIDFELNSTSDRAENFEICDNIIDARGTTQPPGAVFGIAVLGQDPTLDGNLVGPGLICNNTFIGIQFPPDTITNTQSMSNVINVSYTRDIKISGNNVRFAGPVYVQNSLRTMLSDNRFQDVNNGAIITILNSIETYIGNNYFVFDSHFGSPGTISEIGSSDWTFIANNTFSMPAGDAFNFLGTHSISLTGAHSRRYNNFFAGLVHGTFDYITTPGALEIDGVSLRLTGMTSGQSLIYDGQTLTPDDRRTSDNIVTLYSPTDAPASYDTFAGSTQEVGLQFNTTRAGYITAVRFYKHLSDTSTTHNWTLWGWGVSTILAQGTFGTETIFGWQEHILATPIPIAVGNVYTLSYGTNTGFGAGYTANAFASQYNSTPLFVAAHGGRQADAPAGSAPGDTTDRSYFLDIVFQVGALKANNVVEQLITTTSATDVVNIINPQMGNYMLSVYYRVVTAPTNVTISASWTDASGAQSSTLATITEAVGSYSVAPTLINVAPGSTNLKITVTADIANQLYVSANATLL